MAGMFAMFVIKRVRCAALSAEEMRASIPRAAWQKFRPEGSRGADPEGPAADSNLGPETPTGTNPEGRTRANDPNPSTDPEGPAADPNLCSETLTEANPEAPVSRRTRASNPNPNTAREKLRSVAMGGDPNRKVSII